jgi:hypothetical protein
MAPYRIRLKVHRALRGDTAPVALSSQLGEGARDVELGPGSLLNPALQFCPRVNTELRAAPRRRRTFSALATPGKQTAPSLAPLPSPRPGESLCET